nr:hypothetical protein BgiMline_026408 [Biomphalaria glabrata]
MKKSHYDRLYLKDIVASQSCRNFRDSVAQADIRFDQFQRTKKWTSCITFGHKKGRFGRHSKSSKQSLFVDDKSTRQFPITYS